MTLPARAVPSGRPPARRRARLDRMFLLRELIKRDLQSRYAGSLLGLLWALLQPLWQLLLFTFVFAVVLRIDLRGAARTDSFALFLFAAFIPWIAISEGVSRSATAITDGAELVKKMRFPSRLLVLTPVLAGLCQSMLAMLVLITVLLATGRGDPKSAWLLLPALPLQLALTLGLGLGLASLQVFFRDTIQLVQFGLQTWFYLTPIVYTLAWVPDSVAGVRTLIQLNPLTGLVGLYRGALLGESVAWGTVVPLAVVAALALTGGHLVFRALEPSFADEI